LILDQNEEWEGFIRKKYQLASLPVIPVTSFIHDNILVEPFAFLDGGSIPTDIALLKQLASDIPNCRYFEIGTWRGESVSNVAAVSSVCYSLNLPDEELLKLMNSEDFVTSHRLFSNNRKNITHLSGDSRNFDYEGLNMKFDLIFIDGDHHYDTIVKDTRNMLQYLCHDETIVVWHDYTYTPESIRYETLAAILDACPASLHPFLYHVKNTNCALLYRKEISSFPFKKFARPDHCFSVQIKVNPV
jgi:predicted O-methyltransferase YrrM